MTLPYGEDERICAAVSVRQYRRYTEIMEQNVTESIEDAVEANARILSEIFGVPMTQIRKMDAEDVMTAAKQVHFVMQDVITQKFLDLNPEHPEAGREGSISVRRIRRRKRIQRRRSTGRKKLLADLPGERRPGREAVHPADEEFISGLHGSGHHEPA